MRRALLLRGHRTQGAYTDLTDETNQPEPLSEETPPVAAEAPPAEGAPAELTVELSPPDAPADSVAPETQVEPEPMTAEAEATKAEAIAEPTPDAEPEPMAA